jgi:hypothetical protein
MRLLRLLGIVLALAALDVVPAVGAAAHATAPLTASEYRQLQLAQSRIRSLESSDARGLQRANAVCTHLRPVSRLILTVRTGCLDLIRLGGDNARLNARATRCGINPASTAALLRCLVPAVQNYYNDAEGFYRAESQVDQLARARGFTSTCVAVIGDSPANIAAEGRLAGVLRAAVQALEHQNPLALQALPEEIRAAVRGIHRRRSSLAACPHR